MVSCACFSFLAWPLAAAMKLKLLRTYIHTSHKRIPLHSNLLLLVYGKSQVAIDFKNQDLKSF